MTTPPKAACVYCLVSVRIESLLAHLRSHRLSFGECRAILAALLGGAR